MSNPLHDTLPDSGKKYEFKTSHQTNIEMVQGNKKLSKPLAKQSSRRTNSGITKKGHKTIAPKKAVLVRANNLKKKVTAQLTAATERNLAERAGHLEVLKGGKKDKKEKEKEKEKARV